MPLSPSWHPFCQYLPSSACRFLPGKLHVPHALPDLLLTGRVLPVAFDSCSQLLDSFMQLLPVLA